MKLTFQIAVRFLLAKKRAMLMSLSCTILGVGLFIVTQATTSGFERFFTKTILGINGAILGQEDCIGLLIEFTEGFTAGIGLFTAAKAVA